MTYLLDTHLLVWALVEPRSLSKAARKLISGTDNTLLFSAISVLEVSIKFSLGRADFPLHPQMFRRELLISGYLELPVNGIHAIEVGALPAVHKDPFDRLLVAQAVSEGIILLTSDTQVARYAGPVQKI